MGLRTHLTANGSSYHLWANTLAHNHLLSLRVYLNQRRPFVDLVVGGNEQERGLHFENILPVVAHSSSGARRQERK